MLQVPYVVYPNAGRVWDGTSKSWITEESKSGSSAYEILQNIGTWMKLGANIIGGCCQIGPEIIKQISDKITLEMYDAVQARGEAEGERNPDEKWSSVLERLEKSHEDNLIKKKRTVDDENDR